MQPRFGAAVAAAAADVTALLNDSDFDETNKEEEEAVLQVGPTIFYAGNLAILFSVYKQLGEIARISTGFLSEGRARLRAFPCCFSTENTQLSPSFTRKPCICQTAYIIIQFPVSNLI